MIQIRPARIPEDRSAIEAIDRSFATGQVYLLDREDAAFHLVDTPVVPDITKEFPFDDDLERYQGWAAVAEGKIVGYAAYLHQQWNRRTELWHLYVDRDHRGRGIGRALLDVVIDAAREAGSRCLWLETSNVAHPAIAFYRHAGFELCGLDVTLYDPDGPADGEIALFFALTLSDDSRPSPAG